MATRHPHLLRLVRYVAWRLPDFIVRHGDAGGSDARIAAVIGRLHHVIVDCPDPAALAVFYSELLGVPVTWQEDDFVVVSRDGTSSGIAFQLSPGLPQPQWPDPGRPRRVRF
jgi:Glyoxalase-like domain